MRRGPRARPQDRKHRTYLAKAIILATGGLCQVYLYTTNPTGATGDGIGMAYRAGAEVTDMEFVQFHPTALVQFKEFEDIVALPQFLISEAVRGEGGRLLNKMGERFMEKYHVKMELAPRDIVARAIVTEMQTTGSDHVYLSLSSMNPEKIRKRFPVIYKTCLDRGLDITKDNIPVAPAAHYFMGGIRTNLNARTNLEGLFAAGECASTGVHGANRATPAVLCRWLVFGERAAQAARECLGTIKHLSAPEKRPGEPKLKEIEVRRLKLAIKSAMWHGAGMIRSAESLNGAMHKLDLIGKQLSHTPHSFEETEASNLLLVARLITKAALDRTESRGAHYRSDFPDADDKNWKRHLVYKIQA